MDPAIALPTITAPPLWTVVPFAVYLLVIALLPLAFPHFWEHNKNKFILAVIASIPVIIFLVAAQHDDPSTQGDEHGMHWLVHSLKEYVAFIVLLAALFIISGGIYLKGQGEFRATTGELGVLRKGSPHLL